MDQIKHIFFGIPYGCYLKSGKAQGKRAREDS